MRLLRGIPHWLEHPGLWWWVRTRSLKATEALGAREGSGVRLETCFWGPAVHRQLGTRARGTLGRKHRGQQGAGLGGPGDEAPSAGTWRSGGGGAVAPRGAC